TDARFALAKRAMERRLHLQRCACRHGGCAGLTLSAPVHHSVIESDHCPARLRRELFGRAVFAAGARAHPMNAQVYLLVGLANDQGLCEISRRTSRRSSGFNMNGRKRASKVTVRTRGGWRPRIALLSGPTAGS